MDIGAMLLFNRQASKLTWTWSRSFLAASYWSNESDVFRETLEAFALFCTDGVLQSQQQEQICGSLHLRSGCALLIRLLCGLCAEEFIITSRTSVMSTSFKLLFVTPPLSTFHLCFSSAVFCLSLTQELIWHWKRRMKPARVRKSHEQTESRKAS